MPKEIRLTTGVHVGRIESMPKMPKVSSIVAIAEHLRIPPSALFSKVRAVRAHSWAFDPMVLPLLLKDLRIENGMSQGDVYILTNVNVARLENKALDCNLATLKSLADCCEIPVAEIFRWVEDWSLELQRNHAIAG